MSVWITAFQPNGFQSDAFQIVPFVPPFPEDPDRMVLVYGEDRFVIVPNQPIYIYDDGDGRTVITMGEDRTVTVVYEADYTTSEGAERTVAVAIEVRIVVVSPDEPVTVPERSATVGYENRTVTVYDDTV